MQARLSKMSRKERTTFCSEGPGRRILARDSLLLFLDDNKAVQHTGRVVRNDTKDEFLRYDGYFCIGVEFSGDELPTILSSVRFGKLPEPLPNQPNTDEKKADAKKGDADGKNGKNTKSDERQKYPPIALRREDRFAAFVVQANSSVFSYEPILRCLQDMTGVPFQRELVQLQPPQPLPSSVSLSSRVRLALAEDPNQLEAVQCALSQRVSLIQGPPGTGKTYVGVQIVRALIDHPLPPDTNLAPVRILCLCYTNHALDDFLLSLHEDGGIPLKDIVRLGRSPKIHEKLQGCMLNERGDFNRLQKSKYAIAMQALDALKGKISDKKALVGGLSNKWNWRTASAFLKDESEYDFELSAIYEQLQGISHGGFQTSRPDDLWHQWISGRGNHSGTGIWAMPLAKRRELVAEWQHKQAMFLYNQLAGHMLDYNTQVEALQLLKTEPKVPAAADAKVLGCTITSAAKNRDLIAQIRPNIVVVEEAGEILEASLLTCLGPSVKHLIMVGDHKQLRPKLECYELRKESGKGIDFDISLFERLATRSSFPIAKLNEQRRMRPEVCDLIRLTTYPFLKDHKSVAQRDNIRGVSSNVIFIDHDHAEGADTENAVLGNSSKINHHEVEMVREIVRYFVLQGYQPSDMVILTPYLGQLVLIQAELKKIKLEVDINDLDRQELQSADIDIGSASDSVSLEKTGAKDTNPQPKVSVRVATVDNFQGEEAKIIIGSLVRCNDRGEIGFVAGAERINVLLSRSRDGLILLGSATTLCSARRREGTADWPKIIEHLRKCGQVFPGFPAVCESHKIRPDRPIDSPKGFEEHTPCGGCTRKCNKPLPLCPLGHLCSSFCHPLLDPVTRKDVHLNMQCRVKVSEVCKNGHAVERECGAAQASRCIISVSAKCAAGLHAVQQQCYMTVPKECFSCKQLAKKKAKEAEVLAQDAVKQQEVVEEQREQLHTAKFELERVEQESKHLEMLNRLKIEGELVKEKIAEKKEPQPRRTKKNDKPAPATALSPPSPVSTDAPAMVVPDDFDPAPYVPHIKTPRTVKPPPNSRISPVQPDDSAVNSKPAADEVPSRALPEKPRAESPSQSSATAPSKPPAPKPKVVPRNTTAPPRDSSPVPAPEPRSASVKPANSEGGKKTGSALERLRTVLKHAGSEEWMKILQLPVLSTEANQSSEEQQFALLGVQAVLLLANDRIHPSGDMISKIDEIVAKFERLNDDFLSGTVDDTLVHAVHAVLKYAKFVFHARDSDLQQSAKSAAEALIFLVQLNKRQELFTLLPAVWLKLAKQFQPSKVTGVPATVHSDPNSAVARWDFWKQQFVQDEAKLPAKDRKNPPATTPSESVDIMLKLTGLKSVKESMVGMYERISIARLQGNSGKASSYNLRCDGNPGTGKTTVARLYASFLVDVGILPEGCEMKETSGSKLITDGVKGLTTILEEMKENGGGVIFVDETYQLNPDTDKSGRQVLDFILPHAEKLEGEYGKIVWVFAGYAGKMDKLYEHNPGLPSRFPNKWVFEDYSDEELLSIMTSLMQRGGQDISAPPKKKAPKPSVSKPTSVPINNNAYYNPYNQALPDQQDQWGNTWKWNPSGYTWEDSYNNITGTGPTNLGTAQNPLMSRTDNRAWCYDKKKQLWYPQNDPSKTQSWYPGSTPPAPVVPPAKPFTADPKWVRVAITRLGRSRGKVGFGNARAVRSLFDKSCDRQAKRLSTLRRENSTAFASADKMEFLRDDLLGPKADEESLKNTCAAWKKLEAMTGLNEVKQSLNQLVELAVINGDLEDAEMPLRGVALNRIFLGNPGTGKTTVAALYGQILCHLGLLSKGEVKLKNSSDFIGNVLGSSESQTRSILADSEGCVLVIDEAYSLNPVMGGKNGGGMSGSPEPYRTAVIDTIVEQVQGRPGEDRAVVMLGYRKEMENFLADANPGLARRFQMENAFEFADYTDEQLVQILLKKCAAERLEIDVPTAIYGVSQLARARSMPNFGNAGAVDNLLSVAKVNMGARSSIIESDFHKGGVIPVHVEESAIFDDLVGCDSVRAKLKRLQSRIKLAQKKGQDITKVFETNYLFVGAPGTGKTTVARKMGQMFFSLGLLPTNEVMEIKAADLATGFVGQSAHKAAEVIRRAKGKVLFIDEAYQLNPTKGGQFMQEAVDTMMQELTSEELKGKLVVILAGYENEIDEMLQQANPGLRSRFSERMVFDDFTPDLVESIIRSGLSQEELRLSEEAESYVGHIATELCAIPEFGNGRDSKTLVQRIVDCYAVRIVDLEEYDLEVEIEDLLGALESMQKARANTSAKSSRNTGASATLMMPQVQSQFALPPPPPVMSFATMQQKESRVEVLDDSDDENEYVQDISSGFSQQSSNDFLVALQDVLDEEGLNNKTGVKKMTHTDLSDPFMVDLARRLSAVLGVDPDSARAMLREWQLNQEDVEDKVNEAEKEKATAKKEKRKALLPIWRCAVCGRADKPFIACYVSPYIVRYDECDI